MRRIRRILARRDVAIPLGVVYFVGAAFVGGPWFALLTGGLVLLVLGFLWWLDREVRRARVGGVVLTTGALMATAGLLIGNNPGLFPDRDLPYAPLIPRPTEPVVRLPLALPELEAFPSPMPSTPTPQPEALPTRLPSVRSAPPSEPHRAPPATQPPPRPHRRPSTAPSNPPTSTPPAADPTTQPPPSSEPKPPPSDPSTPPHAPEDPPPPPPTAPPPPDSPGPPTGESPPDPTP